MVALASLRSDVVRTITIRGRVEGVDQASTSLQRLATAQGAVAVASEKTSIATIGMERRLATISRRLDADYRNQSELAKVTRDLNLAHTQGLVSMERRNQLLDIATARYGQAANAARGFGTSLKSLSLGFAGGIGSGVAFAAITSLPRAAADAVHSVGELADAATRAGASAEKLQVLRQALEQNGGAAEDADMALRTLNVRLGQMANSGAGPAAHAVAALGLSMADLDRLSPDRKFDLIVDKLAGVDDGARRSALAAELFGKAAGPNMAGVLALGARALADTEDRMRSLGTLMSNEMVAAGDRLDDKFQEIGTVIGVGFKRIVVETADAMWSLADSFRAVENQTSLRSLSIELDNVMTAMGRTQAVIDGLRQGGGLGAWREGVFSTDATSAIADYQSKLDGLVTQANAINQRILDLQTPIVRPVRQTVLDETAYETGESAGEKAAKSIDKVNEALAFQSAQLGRTARDQEIYNQLNAAGVAINSQAGREIASAAGALYDQREALAVVQERFDQVRSGARDFFGTIAHGFLEGKKGAESLADALDNLAGRLLDSGLDSLVDGLLGKQGSQGGGFLQMLLSGFGGGAYGAGALATGSVGIGSVGAGIYHGGGVVGAGGVPMRTIPRLHAGLASDEMFAILQKGERVIPKDMARGSAGGPRVTIHNYASGAEASARVNDRGDVEIVIEEAAARAEARIDARFPAMYRRHKGRNRLD